MMNNPFIFPETFAFLDEIFDYKSKNSIDNEEPVYDIIETDKQYEIHAFMSGLKKENTKINIKKGVLIVEGEKNEKKDIKYKYRKSFDGNYKLRFKIDDIEDINIEKISASMEDGLLKIILPKDIEKLKEKNIKIT